MTRTELINSIIKNYGYKTYLEIGVNLPSLPGWNFSNVKIETKHGVDPEIKANATYKMTSDEFFENVIKIKYDMIFIDGLHIFEQAYKDIINSLKWLNEGGTIIVHDCNPVLEKTQRRTQPEGMWHGDVWKAVLKLRVENPNVSIYTVDTDQGCAVIQKGTQKLFKTSDDAVDVYNFNFFDVNRENILNLISVKQFKRIMGIENPYVKKIKEIKKVLFYKIKKPVADLKRKIFSK